MTRRLGDKKAAKSIENETLEEMIANIKKAPRFDTGNTPNTEALKRIAGDAGIEMRDSTVIWFVNLIRAKMAGVRKGQEDRLNLILERHGKKKKVAADAI